MMGDEQSKKRCWCCIAVGLIILAIGLFADVLGFGQSPEFGTKQIAVVIIGVVFLICGSLYGSKMCRCNCGEKKAP